MANAGSQLLSSLMKSPSSPAPVAASPAASGGGSSIDPDCSRIVHLLQNMIGRKIRVRTKDGGGYVGIYSRNSTVSGGILLLQCYAFNEDPGFVKPEPKRSFKWHDVVAVSIQAIALNCNVAAVLGGGEILTDTAISGMQRKERELQSWNGSGAEGSPSGSLEDGASRGWDQFATNEKKFGIHARYDESRYTTVVDKSSPDYQARLDRASKTAQEIEKASRFRKPTDDDRTEEEKYSGVVRSSLSSSSDAAKVQSKNPFDKLTEVKEFSFNPGAAEFVPNFTSPTPIPALPEDNYEEVDDQYWIPVDMPPPMAFRQFYQPQFESPMMVMQMPIPFPAPPVFADAMMMHQHQQHQHQQFARERPYYSPNMHHQPHHHQQQQHHQQHRQQEDGNVVPARPTSWHGSAAVTEDGQQQQQQQQHRNSTGLSGVGEWRGSGRGFRGRGRGGMI